jgi:hypothetical protein
VAKKLVVAGQVARNIAMALPWVVRLRSGQPRTAANASVDSAYLTRYAYDPFSLLFRIQDFDLRIQDATVGEIGPGDHIPSSLLALGMGAELYVGFDRFAARIDGSRAREVYSALGRDLRRRRPDIANLLDARGIDPARFPESGGTHVQYIEAAFEDAAATTDIELDLMFSFNVLEHVSNIDAVAQASWQLMRDGAIAVHKVDFGAHGPWSLDANPLAWLSVSDATWRAMGSNRGLPNRLRYSEVVDAFEARGFTVMTDIVERIPEDVVLRERPRLARRFRTMTVDSLSVKTAIIMLTKSSAETGRGGSLSPV